MSTQTPLSVIAYCVVSILRIFSVQYEYTCRVMLYDLKSYVSICLQTSISVIPLTARPSFWRHLHEASEIQTVCCK